MDIKSIKKSPISTLLNKLDFCVIRTSNSELWYKSPFRNEQTPSFKVDTNKNIWYDHGEGIGGNILDFIMRFKNCDFKTALYFLRNEIDSFSFHQYQNNNEVKVNDDKKKYDFTKISPLENFILIQYLHGRKLNIEICKKYLVEVYYQVNDKNYFGIGFKNDSEGFEIRNKYVKLCLGKKWYSIIINNKKNLIVFESWSDFISMLTVYPKTEIYYDFLILNSLSMISKVDAILIKYESIYMCLDNDEAGTKSTKCLIEKFKNCQDIRYLFKGFKDFNEYLIDNRQR